MMSESQPKTREPINKPNILRVPLRVPRKALSQTMSYFIERVSVKYVVS